MTREFNPDIFANIPKPQTQTGQTSSADPALADSQKRKIRELEAQVHKLTQRMDKLTLTLEQKSVQLQHAVRSLEMNSKSAVQELAKNQAGMVQKLTERRMADAKIQEMVDRHNQIVHNFEIRMANMQKVASEQEMKIMSYQATIDEILREIRNFKR